MRIQVNRSIQIRLMLEMKFEDDPLRNYKCKFKQMSWQLYVRISKYRKHDIIRTQHDYHMKQFL